MEVITLEEEIAEVWKTLSVPQKQSVIQLIHSFKQDEIEWSAAEIEEYNREIDEAEQRIANGQFTTQEELEKEAKEW